MAAAEGQGLSAESRVMRRTWTVWAGLVDGLVGFNEEEQTVYDLHKRSANFRYVIYPHMHLVTESAQGVALEA